MDKITSVGELKEAIRNLEHQTYINEQFMRKRISDIVEDLKPVNILKNVLRQIFAARETKTNLLQIATGLVSGFLVKRFFKRR